MLYILDTQPLDNKRLKVLGYTLFVLEHEYFASNNFEFVILQKMINLGHLISWKLTKDRLRKPFFYWLITQITIDLQSWFAIT